jgi:flagellar biosynthesis chaperone FliJ
MYEDSETFAKAITMLSEEYEKFSTNAVSYAQKYTSDNQRKRTDDLIDFLLTELEYSKV